MSRVTAKSSFIPPCLHLDYYIFIACVGPVAGSYSDVYRDEKGILGDGAH